MKYFICGIIGGILATIWNILILVVGMFISWSWATSDKKYYESEKRTTYYDFKEQK